MGRFEVRLATEEDAAGIATVKVLGWQAAYRGLIPDTYLDDMDIQQYIMRTRSFLSKPTASIDWVCVRGDSIIGWASVRLTQKGDQDAVPTAELLALYVLASFWHQGVGFLIWCNVEAYLKQQSVRSVELWVLEGNTRAQRFYERQGFVLDGVHKTEIIAGNIELLEHRMCCVLDDNA